MTAHQWLATLTIVFQLISLVYLLLAIRNLKKTEGEING